MKTLGSGDSSNSVIQSARGANSWNAGSFCTTCRLNDSHMCQFVTLLCFSPVARAEALLISVLMKISAV